MNQAQVKQRVARPRNWIKTIPLAAIFLFAGCASGTPSLYTTTPPPLATGPSLTSPVASLNMAPSIEVGDVTAVYVTVTNNSSNPDPLTVTLLQLNWPRAIDQSGNRIDRLDAAQAIDRAGGADKLLAALGSRTSELERPLAHKIADYTPFAIWSPVLLVAAPFALAYSSLQGAEYRQLSKVEARQFQLNPQQLDPFGSHMLTYTRRSVDGLPSLWSEKGYVFFPRGNYTALEVRVRKFEEYDQYSPSGPVETVICPWQ